MLRGEQAHQTWHQRNVEDGNDAEVKDAAQLSGFAAELLKAILQLTQNGASMLLKNQSTGGKQNPFAPALEQRNAKRGFKIANLLRDAGL